MEWKNLIQNNCPQCNHELDKDFNTKMVICDKCKFVMSSFKKRGIVEDIKQRESDKQTDEWLKKNTK